MGDFDPGEYHPAFRKPKEHDHHRRARRLLIGGMCSLLFGILMIYWSSQAFWGQRQRDLAEVGGWIFFGAGALLLVGGSIAWFALDDDEHPETES